MIVRPTTYATFVEAFNAGKAVVAPLNGLFDFELSFFGPSNDYVIMLTDPETGRPVGYHVEVEEITREEA